MAKEMPKVGNIVTEHAWKGTWKRPMLIDERGLHPFTIARMTDHNVRGTDRDDEVAENQNDPEKDFSDPSERDRAA